MHYTLYKKTNLFALLLI